MVNKLKYGTVSKLLEKIFTSGYILVLLLLNCSSINSQGNTEFEHLPSNDEEIIQLQNQADQFLAAGKLEEAYESLATISKFCEEKMKFEASLHYLGVLRNLGKELEDIPREINPLIQSLDIQYTLSPNSPIYVKDLRYAIQFADNENLSLNHRAVLLICMAEYQANISNIDSAIFYATKAVNVLEGDETNHDTYVTNMVKLSMYTCLKKQFHKSMLLQMEASRLVDELKVKDLTKHFVYWHQALLFYRIKDFEKAKFYFLKTNELIVNNDNLRFRNAECLVNLGETELQLGNKKEARKILRQAITEMQNSALKSKLVQAYMALAQSYLEKETIQLCKTNLDSAAIYFPFNRFQELVDDWNLTYAEYWLVNKNTGKAKEHLDKVEPRTLRKLGILNTYYKLTNNFQAANLALEAFITVRDSSDRKHQELQVQRIESEFNRKEQDFKIESLMFYSEAQNRNLKTKNIVLLIGAAMLILLTALIALIFKANKRNKNNRVLLADKNAKLSSTLSQNQLLIKEIHHRVKNNLQVIASLLSMQARKVTDDETKNALKSSKTRVQSMSILHRNLYEGENLKEVRIENYMEQLVENIISTYTIADDIQFELDIDPLAMDVDAMIPLGLISNEIICNAVKHAFVGRKKGKLFVSLKERENEIILTIQDDGVGFQGDRLPVREGSLGNRLINSLIQRLDAQMEISGKNGVKYAITLKKEKMGLTNSIRIAKA